MLRDRRAVRPRRWDFPPVQLRHRVPRRLAVPGRRRVVGRPRDIADRGRALGRPGRVVRGHDRRRRRRARADRPARPTPRRRRSPTPRRGLRHRHASTPRSSARAGARTSPGRRCWASASSSLWPPSCMALYFRTWKMSAAAIIAPARRPRHHDRRLRRVRLRDLAGGGHRLPDDPRLLALRHHRRVRQDPREHDRDGESRAAPSASR